jgi:Cytochrome bd terminal oxidase subunit I
MSVTTAHGSSTLVRGLISWISIPPYFPAAIRLHHHLPHHLSDLHDRALCLPRDSQRDGIRTGKEHYRTLAQFWTKIFAASFAMGVTSGIVLSYQFGTNWSRFSAVLGNVVGPMIGYEVETAFFLEATFSA